MCFRLCPRGTVWDGLGNCDYPENVDYICKTLELEPKATSKEVTVEKAANRVRHVTPAATVSSYSKDTTYSKDTAYSKDTTYSKDEEYNLDTEKYYSNAEYKEDPRYS